MGSRAPRGNETTASRQLMEFRRGPSIPVRYNKRSQLRKPHTLGEDEAQYVYNAMPTSELHPRVKGALAGLDAQMHLQLARWYMEQQWVRRRCTRIQQDMQRDLCRLHVERRRGTRLWQAFQSSPVNRLLVEEMASVDATENALQCCAIDDANEHAHVPSTVQTLPVINELEPLNADTGKGTSMNESMH